jgi:aerobic carbon-monoxide dehydrogenase medium subunit
MYYEKYYVPKTVQEALNFLEESKGDGRLIAGGTDLMLQLKKREVSVKVLVDLSDIQELSFITEENGWIKIGPATTHSQIAASSILKEKARVLAEAAGSVGSPQIRNVGTIGGNVVSAQPAADTTIALLALDAQVRCLTKKGSEVRPLGELFLAAGKSALDPTSEIVTAFEFKAPGKNEATSFMRHAKRKALALPIINLGLWLKVDENVRVCEDVRIAMGPMAPVPVRAASAEAALKGASLNEKALKEAAETLEKDINPRDSLRGGAYYKKEMAKVMLRRAIARALKDLGGEVSV